MITVIIFLQMEEEARVCLAAAQEKAAEVEREREIVKSEQKAVLDERAQCASRSRELDKLAKQIHHDTMVRTNLF